MSSLLKVFRPKHPKTVATSEASTAVPSDNPSTDNMSKEITTPAQGEKVVESSGLEEAAALDKLSEEPVYPSGIKLAIITVALCLSVFLVALVSAYTSEQIAREGSSSS